MHGAGVLAGVGDFGGGVVVLVVGAGAFWNLGGFVLVLGAGGVGVGSRFCFGSLGGSLLVSISVAEAKVIFYLLVVFFFEEGSEGFSSSAALRFLESLAMMGAL